MLEAGTVFKGVVKVVGGADAAKTLPAGVYENQTIEL